MLLVSETDIFDVPIYYVQTENSLTFYEKEAAPETAKSETFTFRRPNWLDIKSINSSAMTLDSAGKPTMDLYRYMDMKVKSLLKDWTLKTPDSEEKLQISQANINKLHPDLLPHLFTKLEERLSSVPK